MARPFLALAAAVTLALMAAPSANAQSSLAAKLAMDRLAAIQPGTYEAGDDVQFTLDSDGSHYLLRFAGDPEVFVLYADHASLGGRVLKYDSGETALQIAGWGGMTLYTDKRPGGLPALRTGDSVPPTLPQVSLDAVKAAAADEAQHLAYLYKLKLSFNADWDALADNAAVRALCFDALQNAARGIDRFSVIPAGHNAIETRVNTVFVATSGKPTLQLKGNSLTVTYDPNLGYAGRASSRAIAHALGTMFHVKMKRR